ncbi:MAG: response regulator [Acidobacteriia bacterium]|nr:response regulator [Terriglobia bacterium]
MAKLLLVEDNPVSRDLLVRRLANLGFEMFEAANGREALLAAKEHRPHLILMDLDMPVMDGRAAMRALRSDWATYRIPIIVLTALSSAKDVADAVASGCYSYETKPVVMRRLVERIEEALQLASPPKEPAAG